MKKNQYLNDLGLVNEYASNLGKYNALNLALMNKNIKNIEKIKSFFEKTLKDNNIDRLNLKNEYYLHYKNEINSSEFKDNFFKLYDGVLFNGFHQGKSSINNFIASIGGVNYIKEVVYFQGNFADPIGTRKQSNAKEIFYKSLIKEFFNYNISDSDYKKYTNKGRLFNADFILALRDGGDNLHLLVVDNKIDLNFLLKHNEEEGPILALSSLASKKSRKVQFKNINTDTESFISDYNLTNGFMEYAEAVNDKNILKVIQAGAYASSFFNFLDNLDLLDSFKNKYVYVVGDVDTDVSSVKLNFDKDRHILNEMRDAYESFKRDAKKDYILSKIKKVYKDLNNHLEGDFKEHNEKEFNRFINSSKEDSIYICLKETLNSHVPTTANSPNMQEQNGSLFKVFMNDKNEIVCFLAGCPGIGKTYSFRVCNKSLEDELSWYFSPRNAINEDFQQSYILDSSSLNLLDDNSRIILKASGTDGVSENGVIIKVINYLTNNDANLPNQDKTNLTFRRIGKDYNFEDEKSEFIVDEANSKIIYKKGKKDGVIKRMVEGIRDCIYKSDNLRKINAISTIQSQKKTYKGNTATYLKYLLEDVVVEGYLGKSIDNDAFEKFVKLCPNIFIMIDEITGSPEGVDLFLDIYEVFVIDFYNLLTEEQKQKINLKIIVADASLPNKNIMEKHLFKTGKIEQDKIYFSSVEEVPPKKAYTERLKYKFKNINKYIDIEGVVINANAYPAKELNLNYHIYNKSIHIEKNQSILKDNKNIRREKIKQEKLINSNIIKNAIEDITVKKYPQTIIFVQDKNRISKLISELENQWSNIVDNLEGNLPKALIDGVNYLVLDAELSDKDRAKHIETINSKTNSTRIKSDGVNFDNELKFVFMTSTASRGISFKVCQSMHIVLQNFNLESYLMELIQCIYRPRGDREYDATAKKYLNFYQGQLVISDENLNDIYVDEDKNDDISDFEYKKNQSLLSVMSYITLLRGTINTRINGYTNISGSKYSLVPVGGKYVNSSSSSLLEEMSGYIKLLEKEIRRIRLSSSIEEKIAKQNILDIIKIINLLRKSFNSVKVTTYNTICKNGEELKDYYKTFIDAFNDTTLKSLINLDVLHDYKFINGLMIFSSKNINDELHFVSNLRKKREEIFSLLEKIDNIDGKSKVLSRTTLYIKSLLKAEFERDENDSISYAEFNNKSNRYVGIPSSAFWDYNNIIKYDYKKQYPKINPKTGLYIEEDEDILNVLDTMKSSITQFSNIRDVLPIVSDFAGNIPFITFKSDTLESLYQNIFNRNYIISSTETNIFNLMMMSNID